MMTTSTSVMSCQVIKRAFARIHGINISLSLTHHIHAASSGRVRSIMGLNKMQGGNLHAMARKKVPKWNPPFMARFIVGLCGVLTILFSIVISVAFSHSVLGVGMVHVFDELPSVPTHLPVHAHVRLLARTLPASEDGCFPV
jgi:hypothetical protein